MRRHSVCIVLCLGWVAVLAIRLAAVPVIHVEEPLYEFGAVLEGTLVTHSFAIENRGDEDLIIENVHAGCGCAATVMEITTLIPRRIVELSVTVDTSGYGGARPTWKILVMSNDPERPEITMIIRGSVVHQASYLIEAKDLAAAGLRLIIDIREPLLYGVGHLLGAFNLPADDIEAWFPFLPKQFPILLIDQRGETATHVAERMLEAGFRNVQVLVGGFEEAVRFLGDRFVTTLDLSLVPLHRYDE